MAGVFLSCPNVYFITKLLSSFHFQCILIFYFYFTMLFLYPVFFIELGFFVYLFQLFSIFGPILYQCYDKCLIILPTFTSDIYFYICINLTVCNVCMNIVVRFYMKLFVMLKKHYTFKYFLSFFYLCSFRSIHSFYTDFGNENCTTGINNGSIRVLLCEAYCHILCCQIIRYFIISPPAAMKTQFYPYLPVPFGFCSIT